MRILATTQEAAAATGLSVWELRRGFREGRYPAIQIGQGTQSRRLRWNIDLLGAAIEKQMQKGGRDND